MGNVVSHAIMAGLNILIGLLIILLSNWKLSGLFMAGWWHWYQEVFTFV
jgi:hypothetical protein